MFMEQQRVDDVLVLTPSVERLDSRNAPDFRRKLEQIIDGGDTRLVLNMAPLKFVDSSGIGAVITVLNGLSGRGRMVLCGLREPVLATFRLTRLDRVCDITDNVDEAVALFRQSDAR
jgi:anti-sigma B factor antagonist